MSVSLPRLRADLLRRKQPGADGATLVIKDPVSGEFFRLQEIEGFVADQLDGETSLERVRDRVAEKFGAPLSRDELAAFVKQLDRSGLLESERGARRRERNQRRRFHGGVLYARWKLVDPERLLNAMAPRVRFFFTPHFVYLAAATILAAFAIGVFNWNEIARDLGGLVQLSTLPLLIVTIFITITLHEFAHGLTCKRFGGEVREMGFMLLYFQPAFFCNVSDAWLFPEKSKRLWVTFAGPFFELFVWALAVLLWRTTDSDTSINHVSLVVMGTSGIKTFFNFNPLIKLDGYYLLSDYLDIPNLRKRSFAYLGSFLKGFWRLPPQLPQVSARERNVYLTYGATAWVFSIGLLSYVGLTFSEYLIAEGQRVAFVGLTGILGFRFRDKFASLFGRRSSEPHSTASRPRSGKSVWRKVPVFKLAGVAAILVLLFVGRMELRVSGEISVLPLHNADVRTEIEGIIDEIYIDEGQHVSKGDLIAKLSDREYLADLQKIEAEILQIRAKLDELIAGPTEAAIEVARLAVVTVEDRLRFAAAKRARTEELFMRRLVSNQEFDLARELEAAAQNELAEAGGKLELLLEGTRPEQINAARAELARLEAQQLYLEGQLQRVSVLSPADGMVTTPSRQLRELVRRVVPKGGLIAKVYELDVITVEAAISEKEIADVEVGQRVAIKTRAYPDRVFNGTVIAIGTTTQDSPAYTSVSESSSSTSSGAGSSGASNSPTSIRVTTEIDNSSGLLKPGMTGMAKIYCGERRFVDLITRRLSRTFRVEFWSWW